MERKTKLRAVCHARSGNKGDRVNVGLAVYDPCLYGWLKAHATAATVGEYLKGVTQGPVARYELANLGALNFVIHGVLEGGQSGTPILDTLGKSFSSILLDMEVEAPEGSPRSDAHPQPSYQASGSPLAADPVRLGCGSAHGWDNIDAAVALAESGEVDYLVFDNITEGIGNYKLGKESGGTEYYQLNEARMRRVIPACAATGTGIITNMGVVDPRGVAEWIKDLGRDLGLSHLRVMAVLGDDVLDQVWEGDPCVTETGERVSSFGSNLLSANAYLNAYSIVEALDRGADVVVSGRVGDSAQFLAPMIHRFGWSPDDHVLLAKGLGIGHLMECGAQVTGGYFPDPPYKQAPALDRVGFPIALVDLNGDAVITKLPGTGGVVNRMTCLEQLLYEIDDPADYRHTDAVVDFTTTGIVEVGPDQVLITGTSGRPKPPTVLVALNVRDGCMGVGEISYGGGGAYERAQLAADIVTGRLAAKGIDTSRLRIDYEGVNSLFPWHGVSAPPREVRLRMIGRFQTQAEAQTLRALVHELSCNGPSGGSGLALLPGNGGTWERILLFTTLLPQADVRGRVVEV